MDGRYAAECGRRQPPGHTPTLPTPAGRNAQIPAIRRLLGELVNSTLSAPSRLVLWTGGMRRNAVVDATERLRHERAFPLLTPPFPKTLNVGTDRSSAGRSGSSEMSDDTTSRCRCSSHDLQDLTPHHLTRRDKGDGAPSRPPSDARSKPALRSVCGGGPSWSCPAKTAPQCLSHAGNTGTAWNAWPRLQRSTIRLRPASP
jgi:hypothetical protein